MLAIVICSIPVMPYWQVAAFEQSSDCTLHVLSDIFVTLNGL